MARNAGFYAEFIAVKNVAKSHPANATYKKVKDIQSFHFYYCFYSFGFMNFFDEIVSNFLGVYQINM
jgi:hypothetical protein